MVFKVKTFGELTTTELYELLRARVGVFVVEQECAYQELDGEDFKSLHIFYEEEGSVRAYLRAFALDESVVRVGRVLTVEHGKGLGGKLLRAGIEEVKKHFNPKKIIIDAQTYAVGYYAREGFEVCSGEFLEDGIPHVGMELRLG